MVSMLPLIAVCHVQATILLKFALNTNQSINQSIVVCCLFKSRSAQTKVYTIGICCFLAKHAVLGRKRKDWLAQNQDNDVGGRSFRKAL